MYCSSIRSRVLRRLSAASTVSSCSNVPLALRKALVDLDTAPELIVLVANELDQLLIRQKALINAKRKRFGVSLGVFDRNVDLQPAESRTAKAFHKLRFTAVGTAVDVEPSIKRAFFRPSEIVRLDDERVAVPPANRVAVPPGLWLALRRKRAAIHIDMA